MPRGKPQGKGGAHKASKQSQEHVAKPAVSEFPTSLQLHVEKCGIPSVLSEAFPEFRNAQSFFSALERIDPEFGGSCDAYKTCWLGLPADTIQEIQHDPEGDGFTSCIVLKDGTQLPTFVKRIHLLDPICAMEGEYVWPEEGALPAPSELWKTALAKLNDPLNEAYVDTLYAAVAHKFVESGISPHWCKSYGTFSARVEKYLFNITDEYDSMRHKPWWRRNQRHGLFKLFKDSDSEEGDDQRFFTEGLLDIEDGDIEVVGDIGSPTQKEKELSYNVVEEEENIEVEASPESVKPVRLTTPKLRLKRVANVSDSSGSGSSGGSSDNSSYCDSEDEIQHFAEFANFPVQVTLLEKLDGTLDELIDEEDEEDAAMIESKESRWSAWLFQIIAALTSAQYWTGFVHNDLHTNNVMWSGTGLTHLYYRIHKGKETYYMSIPTYGRIMKIIDFGRASYTLPEPGGFFISDAFYPGNDAATQYNCEPFYDPKEGKKVEPNTSFDLCRLAISLLESLYPERPVALTPTKIMSKEGSKMYTETVSGIYNMLWEWLTDDDGKNVLRKPDGKERYPDFDLYRALAAEVHKAVPKKQIERPLFAGFKVLAKALPKDEPVYDLYL